MRALVAAVFVVSIIALLLVSGCTDILLKQKAGGFGEVSPTAGTGGGTGGSTGGTPGSPATSACPDTLVWDGSWDSREVGYASNHDVREAGVWEDAGPVPVTLTQKCRDVTGTYTVGACPGTLTGKIGKNVFSGQYSLDCTNQADSASGTFSVTMAADDQSFMGSMYKTGGYGPENGFAPSWWGKKQNAGGSGKAPATTGTGGGTGGTSGAATVPGRSLTTAPLSRVTTGVSQAGTTTPDAAVSQGSCGAGLTQCRVFSTDYCVDLNTDTKHCGKCRFGCYLSNAENGCSGGKCYVKSCLIGWADCNGKDEDGCEISLDADDNNCGQCGRVCSLPQSHAICVGQDGNGKCGPEYCLNGWTNGNGKDEDGCEVPPP